MRRHLARRPTGKQEHRRLSVGAEPQADGTHFRVWAPSSRSVAVVLSEPGGQPTSAPVPLAADEDGYFQGLVEGARPIVYSVWHGLFRYAGEKVIVGRDRCFINEIRPLDTKQMKADRKLLNEQMKKARAES